MNGLPLLGRHNPRLKEVRHLHQKKARQQAGLFLIEGTKLVGEAARSGWPLSAVYATPGWWQAHGERLAAVLPSGIDLHGVEEAVFGTLSTQEAPEGVLAVARTPGAPSDADLLASIAPDSLLVVLVGVADPGNLGTILRAAEAAGATGALLGPGTAEPWSPKATRAAMGSLFRVPVYPVADPGATLEALRGRGVRLLAAHMAGEDLYTTELRSPVAWLLGSEAHGVPPELLALAEPVAIPMHGATESLNVAMAATVVLFETLRQRRSL